MNELKTLKYLPKEKIDLWSAGQVGSTDKPLGIDYKILESVLRQEAIKIMKSFNEGEDTTITGRFLIPLVKYEYSNSLVLAESSKYLSITKETINFIKWFFNITEEDLK